MFLKLVLHKDMNYNYLCHMKQTSIFRIITIAAAVFCAVSNAYSQDWKIDWGGSANALTGTGEYLPFWARTGHDGVMPYTSSGVLTFGADVMYGETDGWNFEAGTNLVGAIAAGSPVAPRDAYGLIDRLYVSGSWKMLHLDLGMKPRARELADISVSGGNVMYSRNARNIPGINAWSDWIWLGKGKKVAFKGNLAHYQMIDNRFVDGAMLHNKALSMKFAITGRLDFSLGFEHWAQWGGVSPLYGPQPVSLMDYVLIFVAGKGREGASTSDKINVLGNHLGKEYCRFDYKADLFTLTAQYDKPFEDGSGMRFKNVPDGIWSLQCSMNDRDAFVTDVIYEFISTTWQSGPDHDRPATEEEKAEQDPSEPTYGKVVLGGCDNYFNNGEYRSGWTNYNRVIGCPLIIPYAPGADGKTTAMASTRVRGHHFGIKGVAFDKIPYRFMATYTKNYGRYKQAETSPFASTPKQLSLALELEFGERMMDLPIAFAVGAYADMGQLYQDSAGLTLRFFYGRGRRF